VEVEEVDLLEVLEKQVVQQHLEVEQVEIIL
jgi:hypothetical protein